MVLLGSNDQSSKIVGMRERFTFIPTVTIKGPLKNYRPCVITRNQGSRWRGAPRKKTERVPNPKFDKNKPISSKNVKFHDVEYRDFEGKQ